MIHVYCIRTDTQNVSATALESRVASVIGTLPASKYDRILHIRPSRDRINSALGWCLLQFALTDRGFADFTLSRLRFDGNRKPHWPNARCDFNLSHAGSLVACAVTDAGRVGIDCEHIRPVNAAALMRRILSGNERTPSGIDVQAFFRLWTQKEAVIKAEGNGGVWDMRRVHVVDKSADYEGTRWYLCPVPCAGDYVTHVASDIADQSITMHAVSIEQLLGDGGNRDQSASMD
jgi:4'-phosphopantetheinyl transferase